MSEWRDCKLGDISVITDCEHKTATLVDSSEYISVRTSNIQNGKIDFENSNRVSSEVYEEWTKRLKPRYKDIVLAREAPVGEVGWIPKGKKVCLGQRTVLIRTTDTTINSKYLLYYLVNDDVKNDLINRSTGSVVEHLNVKDIKNFDLKIHNLLEEQNAIENILSSLDDKIDLLHRQNTTLEAMAETLFRQMMSEHDLNGLQDDQDKTGLEKSCQSINPENHVQDKGEAMEDWETKQLKEVTDIGIGRTPPRKEFQWFSTDPNDVKWISIKDMGSDGVFISNTSEYLTRKAIKTFNIPVIPKHTVVLSFKMTVGRVAITSDEMLSNEAIAHFKFKKNTPFTKEYLFLFLKTFKYDILGSTSSIVTSINSAMIKDLEITIPDASTMTEFKERTEPLFNKINQNQTQIRTLTAIRDTLLPKLMNGEVRVEKP